MQEETKSNSSFCSQCGGSLAPEAKFCSRCGKPTANSTLLPGTQQVTSPSVHNQADKPKSKSDSTAFVSLAAFALLIFVSVSIMRNQTDLANQAKEKESALTVRQNTKDMADAIDAASNSAAGNKEAEKSVAFIRKQVQGMGTDAHKMREALESIKWLNLKLKNLGLDPLAVRGVWQGMDNLRRGIESTAIALKINIEKTETDNTAAGMVESEQVKREAHKKIQESFDKFNNIMEKLDAPKLELQSRNLSRKTGSFAELTGEVKNISDASLDNVTVVATFHDKNHNVITTEETLIVYQPILPGQISPFKVIVTYNPAMLTASLNFKELTGGTIEFEDKSKK